MAKNICFQLSRMAMKRLIVIILALGPLCSFAQKPKMYLKLFGGVNTSTLVYRIENVDSDILAGWQVGGAFRVHYREVFGEIDFTFYEQGITFSPRDDDSLPIEDDVNIRLRGFEVPITVGYVPIKTPLFGWYLYGGFANMFSMKGRINYQDQELKFKPKEASLHFYNLGARFGTQIDIAMLNFDLHYTIGITNSFRDKARTNSHTLALTVGLLF